MWTWCPENIKKLPANPLQSAVARMKEKPPVPTWVSMLFLFIDNGYFILFDLKDSCHSLR
jgi:hypothetical protein